MEAQEINMHYVDKLKTWIIVLCISLGISIGVNFYQRYFIDRQWKLIHNQADFIDELMKDAKLSLPTYKENSII